MDPAAGDSVGHAHAHAADHGGGGGGGGGNVAIVGWQETIQGSDAHDGDALDLLLPPSHAPVDGSGRWCLCQTARLTREFVGMCLMCFFINCQPSEPYLTKYLRTVKNISEADLDTYVWPSDTYASLVFLLPLGAVAEVVGYRAVIFAGLICRQLTRVVLIYGEGLHLMVLMQVTYAAASGANTIIYALVYTLVGRDEFARSTAMVFSAVHMGRVTGSGAAQLMVDVFDCRLVELFYASWAFTSLGCAAFLTLVVCGPRRDHPSVPAPASLVSILGKDGAGALAAQLKALYAPSEVRWWSLWWVFGYSQYYVVVNYYQNIFTNIDPDGSFGVAEVTIEAAAIVGSVAPTYLRGCCVEMGPPYAITVMSFLLAGLWLVITLAQSSLALSITLNAVAFGCCTALYAHACATIADKLDDPRYAVVFSCNAMLSLVVASIAVAVGSSMGFTTNAYFVMAAIQQVVLAMLIMLQTQCVA